MGPDMGTKPGVAKPKPLLNHGAEAESVAFTDYIVKSASYQKKD